MPAICPVCLQGADHDLYAEDGKCYEESSVCPRGCWEYHFSYGYTHQRVGEQWWEWSWTGEEPAYSEMLKSVNAQIGRAVREARANCEVEAKWDHYG